MSIRGWINNMRGRRDGPATTGADALERELRLYKKRSSEAENRAKEAEGRATGLTSHVQALEERCQTLEKELRKADERRKETVQRQKEMLEALQGLAYRDWPVDLDVLRALPLDADTPFDELTHLKVLLQELHRARASSWYRRYEEEVLAHAIGLATYRLTDLVTEGDRKGLLKRLANYLNQQCKHVEVNNYSLETLFDEARHTLPPGHTPVAANTPVTVRGYGIADKDSGDIIYRALVKS